jgi:hypothetical protein
MASKMAKMAKSGHFDYLVEYLMRTLTGKFVLDGQNLIYCIHFQENVQKPQKITESEKAPFWMVFVRFLENRCRKTNSDHIAPTYPSKFS